GVPTGWTQPERPNQESRHLATADGLVGAESVVQRWVASESYPGCRQPLDLGLEHGPIVVEEPALPSASQTLRVVARPPTDRRLLIGEGEDGRGHPHHRASPIGSDRNELVARSGQHLPVRRRVPEVLDEPGTPC